MESDPLVLTWRAARRLHAAAAALAVGVGAPLCALALLCLRDLIAVLPRDEAPVLPFLRLAVPLPGRELVLVPGMPMRPVELELAAFLCIAACAVVLAGLGWSVAASASRLRPGPPTRSARRVLAAILDAPAGARDEARSLARLVGEVLARADRLLAAGIVLPAMALAALILALGFAALAAPRLVPAAIVGLGAVGLAYGLVLDRARDRQDLRLRSSARAERDSERPRPPAAGGAQPRGRRPRAGAHRGARHRDAHQRGAGRGAARLRAGPGSGARGDPAGDRGRDRPVALVRARRRTGPRRWIRPRCWRRPAPSASPAGSPPSARGSGRCAGRCAPASATSPASSRPSKAGRRGQAGPGPPRLCRDRASWRREGVGAFDAATGERLTGVDVTLADAGPRRDHRQPRQRRPGARRVLAGQVEPTAGAVTYAGTDLRGFDAAERARRIAFAAGEAILIEGRCARTSSTAPTRRARPDDTALDRDPAAHRARRLRLRPRPDRAASTRRPQPRLAARHRGRAPRRCAQALAAEGAERLVEPFDPPATTIRRRSARTSCSASRWAAPSRPSASPATPTCGRCWRPRSLVPPAHRDRPLGRPQHRRDLRRPAQRPSAVRRLLAVPGRRARLLRGSRGAPARGGAPAPRAGRPARPQAADRAGPALQRDPPPLRPDRRRLRGAAGGQARRSFARMLPPHLAGAVEFYDPDPGQPRRQPGGEPAVRPHQPAARPAPSRGCGRWCAGCWPTRAWSRGLPPRARRAGSRPGRAPERSARRGRDRRRASASRSTSPAASCAEPDILVVAIAARRAQGRRACATASPACGRPGPAAASSSACPRRGVPAGVEPFDAVIAVENSTVVAACTRPRPGRSRGLRGGRAAPIVPPPLGCDRPRAACIVHGPSASPGGRDRCFRAAAWSSVTRGPRPPRRRRPACALATVPSLAARRRARAAGPRRSGGRAGRQGRGADPGRDPRADAARRAPRPRRRCCSGPTRRNPRSRSGSRVRPAASSTSRPSRSAAGRASSAPSARPATARRRRGSTRCRSAR